MKTPSHYQQAVFDWVKGGCGHGQVTALAGSGKTTTILNSFELLPPGVGALTVAFNKRIAEELQKRVPPHVTASTLHSFGYRMLPRRTKMEQWKTANLLTPLVPDEKTYWQTRNPVTKIVTLLKAEGFYAAVTPDDVLKLIEMYGLDVPYDKERLIVELAIAVFDQSRKLTDIIDYDDMIYLPVYLDLTPQRFDWVFTDEYQDMNQVNHDLIKRITGDAGRLLVVGDRHQAIYGFRGAKAGITDYYVKDMSAAVFPLNICYRCDTEIIRAAQQYVPELEAREGAGQGEIKDVSIDQFREQVTKDDLVLCRCVLPMVKEVLRLIRLDIPAYIRGKEIGDGLMDIIRKLDDTVTLSDALLQYQQDQLQYLSKVRNAEQRMEMFNDQIEALQVLAESCNNKFGLQAKVKALFSDEARPNAICFLTVHKSKGLEADRVFVLRPDLMPHRLSTLGWQIEQERNLLYVAITRARHTLCWVRGGA